MSFTCTHGTTHQHDTTYEARLCWGLIAPPVPVHTPEPMTYAPARSNFDTRVTERQLEYIKNLGGNLVKAGCMNKSMASRYIDQLKLRGPSVTPSIPAPVVTKVSDPREAMILGLLERIPDGYFCTQLYDGAKMNFVRISRPKLGRKTYGGSVKIQTQHGPSLELAAVSWLSGHFSIYQRDILDILMLLVTDYRTCAMRYSREIGRCCRCNTELTDGHSRHYGIGPICDKIWTWVIDTVDEQNDGKPYEQLVREAAVV